MKERYIRQVGHYLVLPRKQKREVLRDLEEIFASALKHGESESQVIERLGAPEEYAQNVQGSLGKHWGGPALVGLVLSCVVCAGAVALFVSTLELWVPANAIGFAQGSTSVQVVGNVNLSPLFLAVAGITLVCAAYFGLKVYRGRKR